MFHKRFLGLMLLLFTSLATADTLPVCSASPVAAMVPGSSCAIGNLKFTFQNFVTQDTAGVPLPHSFLFTPQASGFTLSTVDGLGVAHATNPNSGGFVDAQLHYSVQITGGVHLLTLSTTLVGNIVLSGDSDVEAYMSCKDREPVCGSGQFQDNYFTNQPMKTTYSYIMAPDVTSLNAYTGMFVYGFNTGGGTWFSSTTIFGTGVSDPNQREGEILSFEPLNATPVPEPASLLLLGSGLAAFAARRKLRA